MGGAYRRSAKAVRVSKVLQQHVRRDPPQNDQSASRVVRAASAAVLPDIRADRGRSGNRPALLPHVRPPNERALRRLTNALRTEGPRGEPGRQATLQDESPR